MVIKLSFSRMSSSNQSVLVLKSASYRDIHAGPLLLKSWKFEILDNNDLAIRSKLASLIFRNSVKFSKYSQLSKLKMGHRKNFNFLEQEHALHLLKCVSNGQFIRERYQLTSKIAQKCSIQQQRVIFERSRVEDLI